MNRRAFTALGGAFLALPGLACATEVLGGRVILSITGPTGGGMADINCDLDMLD